MNVEIKMITEGKMTFSKKPETAIEDLKIYSYLLFL